MISINCHIQFPITHTQNETSISHSKSDSLMICILLSFVLSESLKDGFHALTLSEGTHIFDFAQYDVFLRKNTNSSLSASLIDISGGASPYFSVAHDRFVRLSGAGARLLVEGGPVHVDMLLIDKGMCNEYSVSLSFCNYINTTHVLMNESMSLCYIFFQPESDYRVSFDCLSLHRNTICSIHTNESLTGHRGPTTCAANSTCDTVVSNGCLIVIKGADEIPIESSTRIMMIKGKRQSHQCMLRKVSVLDSHGEHEPSFVNKFVYNCNQPTDSVLIAVVLIVILVTIIVFSILIYSKCRPNRNANRSDDSDVTQRAKPRHKHGSAVLAPSLSDAHLLTPPNGNNV